MKERIDWQIRERGVQSGHRTPGGGTGLPARGRHSDPSTTARQRGSSRLQTLSGCSTRSQPPSQRQRLKISTAELISACMETHTPPQPKGGLLETQSRPHPTSCGPRQPRETFDANFGANPEESLPASRARSTPAPRQDTSRALVRRQIGFRHTRMAAHTEKHGEH